MKTRNTNKYKNERPTNMGAATPRPPHSFKVRYDSLKVRGKLIIYPELSYQLVGLFYRVHNKVGPGYQEKVYQNAIEVELKKNNISYKREGYAPVTYEKKNVGKYFVDFVIDNKLVIEVKQKDFFKKDFIAQVLDYLNALDLKLAIIVNFGQKDLKYKRVINPNYDRRRS